MKIKHGQFLPTEPMIDIGDGFPIVLLPGHRFNTIDWSAVVEKLARKYRILIPRLPFHYSPLSVERRTDILTYLHDFITDNLLNHPILIGSGTGAEGVLCLHPNFQAGSIKWWQQKIFLPQANRQPVVNVN